MSTYIYVQNKLSKNSGSSIVKAFGSSQLADSGNPLLDSERFPWKPSIANLHDAWQCFWIQSNIDEAKFSRSRHSLQFQLARRHQRTISLSGIHVKADRVMPLLCAERRL